MFERDSIFTVASYYFQGNNNSRLIVTEESICTSKQWPRNGYFRGSIFTVIPGSLFLFPLKNDRNNFVLFLCLLILFLKNDVVAIIFTLFSQKLSEFIGGFGASCENVSDIFSMTGT